MLCGTFPGWSTGAPDSRRSGGARQWLHKGKGPPGGDGYAHACPALARLQVQVCPVDADNCGRPPLMGGGGTNSNGPHPPQQSPNPESGDGAGSRPSPSPPSRILARWPRLSLSARSHLGSPQTPGGEGGGASQEGAQRAFGTRVLTEMPKSLSSLPHSETLPHAKTGGARARARLPRNPGAARGLGKVGAEAGSARRAAGRGVRRRSSSRPAASVPLLSALAAPRFPARGPSIPHPRSPARRRRRPDGRGPQIQKPPLSLGPGSQMRSCSEIGATCFSYLQSCHSPRSQSQTSRWEKCSIYPLK